MATSVSTSPPPGAPLLPGHPTAAPAVWLLFAASIALTGRFVLYGDVATFAAVAAVLFAGAAAASILHAARSRVGGILAGAGSGILALETILNATSFWLPLSYTNHLRLEVVLAVLPFLAILLLVRGLERARSDLAGNNNLLPLPLSWGAPALMLAGAIARWGAILILAGQPGTVETLRHVLRYDVAFAFSALGAFALAGALAYVAGASAENGRARSPRRVVVALVAALLVFSFVGYNVGVAATVAASPPSSLKIGMHTIDVSRVDTDVVDFVHVDVAWDIVERRPNLLDWSRFDEKIRQAEERGLGVYLLAGTYPPRWLAEEYPDAVMVDQNGERFTWIDEAPTAKRERIWDLSFAHPEVVALKQAFLAKVVKRYAESPAVFVISIQNEPAWPVDWNLFRYASYDPWTVAAFQDHLEEKYGTLETFYESYPWREGNYESFRDIDAPIRPFDALWSDWMRFREDLLISFVEGQTATVREFTDKPVTVKIMAHFFTRFAEPQAGLSDRVVRAFANASDVVSLDVYPVTLGDLRRELEYFKHVADGKDLLIAEFNFLFGSNLPTSGARLLAAFDLMDEYATHVTMFTDDGHFLYGFHTTPRSPGLLALKLVKTSPFDPEYHTLLASLILEDFLAIQNVHTIYVLGMQAAGFPAIPMPLFLLVLLPVPSPTERIGRYVTAGRAGMLGVAVLVILVAL